MDEYASPGVLVVKYGGNALPQDGAPDPILAEIAELWKMGTKIVLVHGGGPEIDAWLAARNVTTHRIDGLRVTDAMTLEITEAVLCGTLNKRLVRDLLALGTRAVGISGQDAALLTATRAANADLGFVGIDVECDVRLLGQLLDADYLPVIAPLAYDPSGHTALNVNADSAAAAVATALRADAFLLLTNVTHVRANASDPASAIGQMTVEQASVFATSDACAGGMKPKIEAAIAAAASGVRAHIGGAGATLEAALRGESTMISNAERLPVRNM